MRCVFRQAGITTEIWKHVATFGQHSRATHGIGAKALMTSTVLEQCACQPITTKQLLTANIHIRTGPNVQGYRPACAAMPFRVLATTDLL